MAFKIELRYPAAKSYIRLLLASLNFLASILINGGLRYNFYYITGHLPLAWSIQDFTRIVLLSFLSSTLLLVAVNALFSNRRSFSIRMEIVAASLIIYCYLWWSMITFTVIVN
jgi:hypothetical protein